MKNYNYDSVVSKSEAEALKEMIFKRARERAAALTENTQNSYTTSFKQEIMELAHDTFTASKNPFSISTESSGEKEKNEKIITQDEYSAKDLIKRIETKHLEEQKNINEREFELNMEEARNSLSKNHSFMGALNFLNAQATISLVKNKGKSFEAIA